jgi:hypothetical protein
MTVIKSQQRFAQKFGANFFFFQVL